MSEMTQQEREELFAAEEEGRLAVTEMQMRHKPCAACARALKDGRPWPTFSDGPATSAPSRPGDPRFHQILDEMRALHEKKGTDYGNGTDLLANVRVAEQWGVPPWLGVMIRATDKVTRLQSYAKTGHLANEGAEDSLMDLAAYSIIALILLREEDQ